MSFCEFLAAIDEKQLSNHIRSCDWQIINMVHDRIVRLLRLYLYIYIGGMPEAVQAYCDNVPLRDIRTIHNEILTTYRNDFSKHAPKEQVIRITQVLQSLPAQIAKENKKFIFGMIKKGARAKEFEMAIQWLQDAGIIRKICNVNKPHAPLNFYEEHDAFKLFLLDCSIRCNESYLSSRHYAH